MQIHVNANDGQVHIHDCPAHRAPCRWDEHDAVFRAAGRALATEHLRAQLAQPDGPPADPDLLRRNAAAALAGL